MMIVSSRGRTHQSRPVSKASIITSAPVNHEQFSFWVLTCLLWSACVLPSFLLLMTADRRWGQTLRYTPFTQLLRNVLIAATVAFSIFVILKYGRRLLKRSFGIVFILILLVIFPVLSEFFRLGNLTAVIVPPLITLVILFAVFSLNFSLNDLKILGVLGAFTGFISLLMALLRPESAYSIESGVRVLAGPFDNSNYLGMFLTLLLPFILLLERHGKKIISSAFILVPIFLGGSDTSILSASAVVLIFLIYVVVRKTSAVTGILSMIAFILLVFSITLPYLISDPNAFTKRGIIWILARQDFGNLWFWGAGTKWFSEIVPLAGYRVENAHNVFLQAFVIGGVFNFILVLTICIGMAKFGIQEAARRKISPYLFVVAFLVMGATGYVFLLDFSDLRFFASGYVIFLLVSLASNSKIQKFELSQKFRAG